MYDETIRIGTMVPGEGTAKYIKQILAHGFECFEVNLGPAPGIDLARHADQVLETLGSTGAVVSCLGCYGNPLADDERGEECRAGWARLIDAAHLYRTDLVCGFAGRVPGRAIDACIPRFAEVFGPLAQRAQDKGVRLAFENCPMGGNWQTGDWNIAHGPDAWERMFDALDVDNVGLEWEPCHQMVNLIDPLPQLRRWVGRVFHLHGKDATILWDVVRTYGTGGSVPYAFHRTPGFGDSNWTDIVSELRRGGFRGAIDIEGWHDPVYRGDLEMTGQVHALNHLKACRGRFVANPIL